MEIFDYDVLVQKLGQPLGKNKYFAKIHFVYAKTANGTKDIKPDLGECYGVTEEEARSNMNAKYQEWLAMQN